ncbi:MAG: DUF4180 domain-containing protein [Marinilabiliales bacterium]|nr:MAG: DUF4180 domain-containing protein [Marinilabiliales bacterium]
MEFIEHKTKNGLVVEVKTDLVLKELQDFIDILGNAYYLGANGIVVQSQDLHNDFFELKTKLAGEILQKFSNYRQKLAIIGNYDNIESKSLNDFIRESNKFGNILFVSCLEDAFVSLQ